MKRKLLFIVIIFLSQSCQFFLGNDCVTNEQVKNRYFNYIIFLEGSYNSEGKSLSLDEIEAITFLSLYSELGNRAALGDVSTYTSYNDFEKDIEDWKKWFSLNKCQLNQAKSDSIYNRVYKSFEKLKNR